MKPKCPHCKQEMQYLAGYLGGHGPGGSWACVNDNCEQEDPMVRLAKEAGENLPIVKEKIKQEKKEKANREVQELFA